MDTGYIMYIVPIVLYSIGSIGVLLWFWWKVRPKFPSVLATGIVVFFGVMVVLFIDLILEFAMAPLRGGALTPPWATCSRFQSQRRR